MKMEDILLVETIFPRILEMKGKFEMEQSLVTGIWANFLFVCLFVCFIIEVTAVLLKKCGVNSSGE